MAVQLGRANVEALLRSLTAKQFHDWERYAELEPFGEKRADYRAASICATIANVNRGKGQKAYAVEDFVLKFEQPESTRQTWQQQLAIANAIALAFNAPGLNS